LWFILIGNYILETSYFRNQLFQEKNILICSSNKVENVGLMWIQVEQLPPCYKGGTDIKTKTNISTKNIWHDFWHDRKFDLYFGQIAKTKLVFKYKYLDRLEVNVCVGTTVKFTKWIIQKYWIIIKVVLRIFVTKIYFFTKLFFCKVFDFWPIFWFFDVIKFYL